MKSQLQRLGLSIDWDKEVSTCDENYYKQQQVIFSFFFKKGLVYKKESYVNWDPIDQTVLANEQVIDGKGWRSGGIVEKKKLSQWFLNITKYSEELLDSLENLKGWPEKVKLMQKNWIGKSIGCEIDFLTNNNEKIKIFTTRPDTIFGASFIAIAPDHPFTQFFKNDKNKNNLENGLIPNGYKIIGWNNNSELILKKWKPYYESNTNYELNGKGEFNGIKITIIE